MGKKSAAKTEHHTWTTRQFAELVRVSSQAVLTVVREHLTTPKKKGGLRAHVGSGFPFTVDVVNGREAFRFDAASLDWWKANRGESANVSGHGGKREGGGRPAEKQSSKRKEKNGYSDGEDDQDLLPDASAPSGELTLANISNRKSGKIDIEKLHLLSKQELSKFNVSEQAKGRRQERLIRAGDLLERSDVVREWTRRAESIRSELESIPTRAASLIQQALSIEPASATAVRDILVGVVRQVELRLGDADSDGNNAGDA